MGNESHKEDRNAYPIRHCTPHSFVVSADFQQHIISPKKGEKNTRTLHLIHICKTWLKYKPGSEVQGCPKEKLKSKSKAVCLLEGWAAFFVCHFIYFGFGADASRVTGTEHSFWSSNGSILCIFRYIENSMESVASHQCIISFCAPAERKRLGCFVCVEQWGRYWEHN